MKLSYMRLLPVEYEVNIKPITNFECTDKKMNLFLEPEATTPELSGFCMLTLIGAGSDP